MNKPERYWFAAAVRLMPAHPMAFLVFALLMAALLTFICFLTGEPPLAVGRLKRGAPSGALSLAARNGRHSV